MGTNHLRANVHFESLDLCYATVMVKQLSAIRNLGFYFDPDFCSRPYSLCVCAPLAAFNRSGVFPLFPVLFRFFGFPLACLLYVLKFFPPDPLWWPPIQSRFARFMLRVCCFPLGFVCSFARLLSQLTSPYVCPVSVFGGLPPLPSFEWCTIVRFRFYS